jgi:hypothetical protein
MERPESKADQAGRLFAIAIVFPATYLVSVGLTISTFGLIFEARPPEEKVGSILVASFSWGVGRTIRQRIMMQLVEDRANQINGSV